MDHGFPIACTLKLLQLRRDHFSSYPVIGAATNHYQTSETEINFRYWVKATNLFRIWPKKKINKQIVIQKCKYTWIDVEHLIPYSMVSLLIKLPFYSIWGEITCLWLLHMATSKVQMDQLCRFCSFSSRRRTL